MNLATFLDLLNIFFWILTPFENRDFPSKVHHRDKNSRDHQDRNNHKNQTKHDKDLKNSLKRPQHMKVKAENVLGSILM